MRYHAKVGAYNETAIVYSLDKRYFKDLSDNWKRHMRRMFKKIEDDDYIRAKYHDDKLGKPDIEIKVKNRTIYLSIKSGNHPQMHNEPIKTFFDFLRTYNVPERIIKIIAFYHYGYSLKKGVTKKLLTREEIIKDYSPYIQEVNSYFRNRPELINELIYRSVIRGRLNGELIDYFYYGNSARGLLFSTRDIIKLIMDDKNEDCQSICFNSLVYGACERKVNGPKHHSMKLSWPILCHYFYDPYFMKRFG